MFYSGHDARNEYVYKYVSDAPGPADANRPGAVHRLAIGSKYMDNGTLYVARFHADGGGEWLPLTPNAKTQDGRMLAAALGLAENDLAGMSSTVADLMGAPMDAPSGPR